MIPRYQSYQARQEMKGDTCEIFNYNDPRRYAVPVHTHDFYEVYFYLSGNVQFMVEDMTYSLLSGDILLIRPGTLHRAIVDPSSKDERLVLWIDKSFLAGLREPDEDLSRCFQSGQKHLRPMSVDRADIRGLAMELVSEFYGNAYCSKLASLALFIRLMVAINRVAASGGEQVQSESSEGLVPQVLSYIGAHYAENLSLDLLAAKFYVSKYHLSHEFTRAVGTSAYKYITIKRLVAARQMIADGMSPGDACQECGYRDYANFYRAFVSFYGISPTGIR